MQKKKKKLLLNFGDVASASCLVLDCGGATLFQNSLARADISEFFYYVCERTQTLCVCVSVTCFILRVRGAHVAVFDWHMATTRKLSVDTER